MQMDKEPTPKDQPFDQKYFHSGPYARVSYKRFSQYWWSNRFYAALARRNGPQTGRVLEVGCGLGHLLTWLTDRYQVAGTDVNAWALDEARRNVPKGQFFQLSAEEMGGLESGSFQILIAKHVVEHLSNPEAALAEFGRLLASAGLLLLATPNLDSPMRVRKQEGWIGYQDPTHISLRPPAVWLAGLQAVGFRIRRVFSDGFWDAPYVTGVPTPLQKLYYGLPGGLQAVFGWSILPLQKGESLIVLAEKV
jgi:SAM-dependent methyltransferase